MRCRIPVCFPPNLSGANGSETVLSETGNFMTPLKSSENPGRRSFRFRMVPCLGGALFLLMVCGCYPGVWPKEVLSPGEGGALAGPETLPGELTPLEKVEAITRGGLAVLMVMELPAGSFPGRQEEEIVIDVSDHWARKEIVRVVGRGWMSSFSGHRFRPDLPVTRGEAARIFAALLVQRGIPDAGPLPSGKAPVDLPRGHLLYPAVRRLLALGIMELDPAGNFNPLRPISGLGARACLRKIRSLSTANPPGRGLR